MHRALWAALAHASEGNAVVHTLLHHPDSGKNAGVPRQSAAIAASIGAFAGFMLAYQGSSGGLIVV